MGKKTLEEIGKILLVSFISILITGIYARRRLLDGKLDKTAYDSDQELRWNSHNITHELERENDKRNTEMINWLYQNEIKKGTYRIPPLKLEDD